MSGQDRLPVVVVGAGAMGGDWIRMLAASPVAEPVGVVDLDLDAARRATASAGLPDAVVGTSVSDVAGASGARAVVNVTVPQAHRVVNEEALRAGYPVLCEKPLAPTVAEALAQVALADLTGNLLVVSQSRRYFRHLTAFRAAVAAVGPLGAVGARFFHADHEPGFREQMAHPLLVDMSVHHFDMLRFLVDDEPVAVRCSSWNPPWSWFAGHASASAEFELASGARFVYTGSRATPGLQTSWNADWHVHGEHGAAGWDGDERVTLDVPGAGFDVVDQREGIEGSLEDFVRAVRTGTTPQNEVRHNVRSLAMVEGALRSSADGGRRVAVTDLLEDALAHAVAHEPHQDVAARLRSWTSAADGIETPAWGSAPAMSAGGAR
ncbi:MULTISPECIES: Gfo/Idh/MocA family protein [unclassified Curtobacterium]|uniref:Gfo/Idh/MocA family protein n=1 Tax=unclassified Curtobacterium TaxID=257496 RepID=UPI0008DC82C8|nr:MULTISPECIES: Gfo/Idh/MocA family oxidoreductase [unclassified Curtobacterium]OIH98547.1 deaminase [Curtobacterium sp. MCBA15_003]OII12784.1 deaminase [Curtobacterium sp. MCBA15_009]OII32272.1 deaminase [Curtobacterium sp. MMLR14_006]